MTTKTNPSAGTWVTIAKPSKEPTKETLTLQLTESNRLPARWSKKEIRGTRGGSNRSSGSVEPDLKGKAISFFVVSSGDARERKLTAGCFAGLRCGLYSGGGVAGRGGTGRHHETGGPELPYEFYCGSRKKLLEKRIKVESFSKTGSRGTAGQVKGRTGKEPTKGVRGGKKKEKQE